MDDSSQQEEKPNANIKKKYPQCPIRPLDSDCCGSGCTTCVFDLYELDLKRWNKRCASIDSDNIDVVSDNNVIDIYEYKSFRIADITNVSETVKTFKFLIPGNGSLALKCGQHLIAR